jgi:hypothetical protein
VRRGAGLQAHQGRRKPAKKLKQPRSPDSLADDHIARCINRVNLKKFFARSIPTVVICSMDGAPLMMSCNDNHHGTQMPLTSAVHTITVTPHLPFFRAADAVWIRWPTLRYDRCIPHLHEA